MDQKTSLINLETNINNNNSNTIFLENKKILLNQTLKKKNDFVDFNRFEL